MTDDQIIELIRKGKSERAFLVLYKNFPMVKKMVLSKGGKKEDAEDIYQEALIVLYRKVTETDFKLTSKLSTYMYSVSRFLWKDQLLKRGKLQYSSFDHELDQAEEESLNEIQLRESKIMLAEKIIQELGGRCKELLILFYSETMKLKEIASKMGYSSENTAKNQKYKCLESARNRMKEARPSIQ